MKKHVVILSKNAVTTDEVHPSLYYGVIREGEKAFVTRTGYLDGEYVLRCKSSVTRGNGYPCFTSSSLRNLIEKVVSSGDPVFQFNTAEELFTWLATPVKVVDNSEELV